MNLSQLRKPRMPKNGSRMRNFKNSEHFEHDDRSHSSNTRRVSFKPGTHKGKNKWNKAMLLLDDADIDMTGSGGPQVRTKGSYRGRGGRLNSPAPRAAHGLAKKRFIIGQHPWYQIIIPYGAKHEKDVIMRALLSFLSPDVFVPYCYKTNGNTAVFYVDEVKLAEKLFHADRKIMMSDGFKLMVIVRNAFPNVTIDATIKEKMKLTMAKRYNAATKALDLTKFHADPDLRDVFCAVFRTTIMAAIVDIITENIPDLEALNLNENRLHGLEHFKIISRLRNLKILYLAENRIPFISTMEPLRSLPLVELNLQGNPMLDRYQDHETYVRDLFFTSVAMLFVVSSDMRRKFPKLVTLDGAVLPPAIGFDVQDIESIPPRQQSFLVDPAGQILVRDFLTQYFAIYDGESRQQLLEAYHEHATMSLAANYLSNDNNNRHPPLQRLHAYISNSRNLIRITERESRRRYLRSGRLQVVSFLSDLPKTTHDLMGFAVDLLVFTPAMIVLSMNGVYKETNTNGNPTRSFHRTFVIVPNPGGGFSVINDMLFVTNTTKEQEDKAFATQLEVAPAPAPAAPQPVAVAPAVAPAGEDAQKMMLNALSQQTGMNEHWSINCLQETGWDFQRALFVFNQLNSEGKIPPDAFVK